MTRDQVRIGRLEPCLPGHHALLVSWFPDGLIVTAPTSGPGEAEAFLVKLREFCRFVIEEPTLLAQIAGVGGSEAGAG